LVVSRTPEDVFEWSSNSRFTISTREPYFSYWSPPNRVYRIAEWDIEVGCVSFSKVTLPERHHRTLSPNGRMLAAWGEQMEGGGYPIIVYEVESGRERCRFLCDDPCLSAYFSPDGGYLLGEHAGVPHILWDVRGRHAAPLPTPDTTALERAWNDLASQDAEIAFRAIKLLASFPEQSLPLLRTRIPPVAGPDRAVVERLVAALGAEDFQEREEAGQQLEKLGWPVVPALRAAAGTSTSPEVVRRATEIVRRVRHRVPAGPHLVPVRSVEVVEWIGTPDGVKLLQHWASGAGGSRLTEEAKGALTRLAKR
jgi:hypothetical protein